jgi:ribosomal protein S9
MGRALVAACAECEDDLKDTLVLYEDTRQKTSKYPGKKGAYARRNWTLR